MNTRNFGEPWPGTTYGGFAGGSAAGPPPREAAKDEIPSRSGMSKRGLIGGVAAALLAGVVFGVFARPELGDGGEAPSQAPAQRTAETPSAVPVVVGPITPAPAPQATTTPMEVLPPDVRTAQRATVPPPPPPLPVERRPLAEAPPARNFEAPPSRRAEAAAPDVTRTVAPPPARVEPARPRIQEAAANPGFNCRYARTRSEQMICSDAGLAQLDRRLNAAFRMAVNSGVPYRDLRADQDDWLEIREDAAAYSRGAVANIYRQRISELEAMAGGR